MNQLHTATRHKKIKVVNWGIFLHVPTDFSSIKSFCLLYVLLWLDTVCRFTWLLHTRARISYSGLPVKFQVARYMQQVSWELNKEDHLILFVSSESSWWSAQSNQGKALAPSPYWQLCLRINFVIWENYTQLCLLTPQMIKLILWLHMVCCKCSVLNEVREF